MSLDDFNKWIRAKMGISDNKKTSFDLNWKSPIIPEIEISADDKSFIWTERGIFYQGRSVVLYIRDQAIYGDYETEYKFHITGCATLKSMHTQGRYDKYVLSENTTGKFKINIIVDNKVQAIERELHVCKNCLRALNWKDYKNNPQKIYQSFSIEEFFKSLGNDNQKNFARMPDYTDMTAPPNIYPANWAIISKQLRNEADYICSECHRKILDSRNLHVHHRNGIKADCSRANLQVLCAECHQRKHNHRILKY